MKTYFILLITVIVIFVAACDSGPASPRGFSLPQGDSEAGKQVFLKHQCLSCHQLEGLNDDEQAKEMETPVVLGGEKTRVTTYAELVTSIINPSHKIARSYKLNALDNAEQSPMRNYNDVMTVTELVDVVAYLQPHYKVKPHEYTTYGRYY